MIVAAISMVINIVLNILFLKTSSVRAGAERRAGIGDSAGVLFRFFRAVYYFSVAAWAFGDQGDFIARSQGFSCAQAVMGVACWFAERLHGIYDVTRGALCSYWCFVGLLGGATALYIGDWRGYSGVVKWKRFTGLRRERIAAAKRTRRLDGNFGHHSVVRDACAEWRRGCPRIR